MMDISPTKVNKATNGAPIVLNARFTDSVATSLQFNLSAGLGLFGPRLGLNKTIAGYRNPDARPRV